MKRFLKYIFSLTIAITMMVMLIPSTHANTEQVEFKSLETNDTYLMNKVPSQIIFTNNLIDFDDTNDSSSLVITRGPVIKVIIFLLGIPIAEWINGKIEYYSGHSSGEWLQIGIDNVTSFLRTNHTSQRPLAKVYTDKRYVTGYTTSSGQQCYRANPNQNWSCMYSLEV